MAPEEARKREEERTVECSQWSAGVDETQTRQGLLRRDMQICCRAAPNAHRTGPAHRDRFHSKSLPKQARADELLRMQSPTEAERMNE